MSEAQNDGPEPQEWKLEPARDLELGGAERMRSLARERGVLDVVASSLWWASVRGYLATWHRLQVTGRENIPKAPPFVMVANHTSHLDVLALATAISPKLRASVFPIAAGDHFFESNVRASFSALVLNALPMWRKRAGRHALQQLRERLVGDPCGFILFPEGTRSRTGEMGTFKAGLGTLVAGTDVPVIPCYLEGCYRALPCKKKIPRPRKLRLRIGEAMRFAGVADDRHGWKEIASSVEEEVKRLARTGQPQTISSGTSMSG